MSTSWRSGDTCVLRGVVNGRVWLAQSVILVHDRPNETVLVLLPGAECAYPEGYWRRKRGDHSLGTRWEEAQRGRWAWHEFSWQRNRILMVLEPDQYYACWLFWDSESDQFQAYYINFQLPYRRSRCGFDTFDLALDIVIEPDFAWRWKDEDEYHEGRRTGGLLAEWVQGIEAAREAVLDRIRRRRYPLDDTWLAWRPDPAWLPPGLPRGWQEP